MLKIIHVESTQKVNDKDTKVQVGDHVRISKYKTISAKAYTPNWSENIL